MVTRLFSFKSWATVVGAGLGGVTAWHNCDESRRYSVITLADAQRHGVQSAVWRTFWCCAGDFKALQYRHRILSGFLAGTGLVLDRPDGSWRVVLVMGWDVMPADASRWPSGLAELHERFLHRPHQNLPTRHDKDRCSTNTSKSVPGGVATPVADAGEWGRSPEGWCRQCRWCDVSLAVDRGTGRRGRSRG